MHPRLKVELQDTINKKSISNAPILVERLTLKHVVTLAAECETAGVFHNAQTAIPIQHNLNAIGHP